MKLKERQCVPIEKGTKAMEKSKDGMKTLMPNLLTKGICVIISVFFAGVNLENKQENSLDELSPTAIAGFKYLTPYMFNLDVRIDNELRSQICISRELMIFSRTNLYGEFEYLADFGWINDPIELGSANRKKYSYEITWSSGLEYILSKNIALMASYDNRFGAGGGLSIRF